MIIVNPLYDALCKCFLGDIKKGDVNEPLVKKMVDRLGRAIASDEMRDKMDVEDEIDRIFEREIKKAEAAKDKIIAKKDEGLEAKGRELEAERQKNADLLRHIAELQERMKK